MGKGGGGGGIDIPDSYTIAVGGTGTTIGIDADLDNIKITQLPEFRVNVVNIPQINAAITSLPRIAVGLDIALKEIPDTRVHLPANFCVGFSLFGFEVWRLSLCGEAQVISEKYRPRRAELDCT